eukprot:2892788-Alexandrium_andersonii.AAC.1
MVAWLRGCVAAWLDQQGPVASKVGHRGAAPAPGPRCPFMAPGGQEVAPGTFSACCCMELFA